MEGHPPTLTSGAASSPALTVYPGNKGKARATICALDEVTFGKPARQHVKEFGALFGTIFYVIAALDAYKGRPLSTVAWFTAAGLVIATLGYLAPAVLRPVWKAWMAFAHVLSVVMTFVILSACWIVVLMPVALLMKVIGKSVMKTGFRNEAVASYWEVRSESASDFKLLERQF